MNDDKQLDLSDDESEQDGGKEHGHCSSTNFDVAE